jgi:hypothetical protein
MELSRMPARALLSILLASLAGCAAPRSFAPEEFDARQIAFDQQVADCYERIRYATELAAEVQLENWRDAPGDEPPTLDILILSSGGADGAFGAGFLQGWGEIDEGDFARPDFDRVTGVSTGALMAPFAMLGTDDAYGRLVEVYSNPQKSWVRGSALFSVLFGSPSLFDTGGLQRLVRDEIDGPMLSKIATKAGEDGLLLVGATNLDLGHFQIFDMTHIAREGDEAFFEDVMLASSAIPGVFPPIEIDGWLYGDGGATANLFLGVDRDLIWREDAGPWWDPGADTPKLRIRHWVIVNGRVNPERQRLSRNWGTLGRRALEQMIRSSNVHGLQQLDLMRRYGSRRPDVEFEVYWVAIPDDAVLPESRAIFDRDYMRALVDLGRRMGRDPSSWRTESPMLELNRNNAVAAQ